MDPVLDPAELPDATESMSLASRARDGDPEALNRLLAEHGDWLRRVARIEIGARLRRVVDSVDLVQDVGLIASRKISELPLTHRAGVMRWLRKILALHVRDVVGHYGRDKRDLRRDVRAGLPFASSPSASNELDRPVSDTGPLERASKRELREILDQSVAQLPDHYRQVVLMRDYEHAGWPEIREELGAPSETAVRHLHRRAWVRIRSLAAPRLVDEES